jgi:hypothetical protein
MLYPVPLMVNCLIKTDHPVDYALTWRLDGLDVHSNLLGKLGHVDFNTGISPLMPSLLSIWDTED